MEKSDKTRIYESAVEIARYYGFASVNEVFDNLPKTSQISGKKRPGLPVAKEGVAGEINRPGLMKVYLENNFAALPHPVMIYHTEPLRKNMERSEYGGEEAVLFALEIIGVSKSIAEALLLKVALMIIEEVGFEDLVVELNSLGDRESITRFGREFNTYYRKHVEEVPAHCRTNLKKDIFRVLECAQDKCMLLKEHAPKPIASLTEESREHFTEVLEFLESMEATYRINNCLVGGKDYYTKTIFEIQTENKTNKFFPRKKLDKTLARGGRYDDLSKIQGAKKEVSAVGITISLGGLGIVPAKRKQNKKEKKPKVYLIHLGFEAKIKSLIAIEILRKGKIPIYQSLSKDRLSAQIASADSMKIPFMIIIGQKEALEGTAIVRNMKNRSQETVPVLELPRFVKIFEKEM
ncbi:MAG: ATP phosphoribosyltransferase regulatory subunit [bacterium]|nr:ATP phosphoribosyltransferase regulatory subunit [bacterium]